MSGTRGQLTPSLEHANRLMQMQTNHGRPHPLRQLPSQFASLHHYVQEKLLQVPDDTRLCLICDIFVNFYALGISQQRQFHALYSSIQVPDFVMELDSSVLRHVVSSYDHDEFWTRFREILQPYRNKEAHTKAQREGGHRTVRRARREQLQQKRKNPNQPDESQQRDS